MPAPYFETLARCGGYVALRTLDDDLLLVQEHPGEEPPKSFGAQFPALQLFLAVCEIRPLVYHWRDQLLGRPANMAARWRELTDVHKVNYILQSHVHLTSCPAGSVYDELAVPNAPEETTASERMASAGFQLYTCVQMAFCHQILAAIADFPRVVGFLSHPIHGTPQERWLFPCPTKPTDPTK